MKLVAVAVSLAMLLVPAVQAAGSAVALDTSCAERAGPPCGYITPIVDMQFDKPACPGSPATLDVSKCIPLPEKGKSVSFKGMFRYYWKESEDLTYPPGVDTSSVPPSQDPVVVTFSGVSTNPKWLTFAVEPKSITIDAVALLDPRNLVVDQSNPSSPVVYYMFKQEITVTFTHSGDPDAAAVQKVVAKHGLVESFLKAKTSASGTYFKEGFGVESFRFDGRSVLPAAVPTNHSAPDGALLAPLGGLAFALAMRRRRTA